MPIVEVPTPQMATCEPGDLSIQNRSKHQLDRGSFALIIISPKTSDNGKYECQLRVLNPASPVGATLQFPDGRALTLTVDGEYH